MFKQGENSGVLITGKFRELVGKIAKMAERTGGWRIFYTDDPAGTFQAMFIGSRLRDTALGALGDDTATDRELKWGDMPKEEIDRDDLLEIYRGIEINGLVYSDPMIRFRVTPDDRYYLLDYETDLGEDGGRNILVGEQALEISEKWIMKLMVI